MGFWVLVPGVGMGGGSAGSAVTTQPVQSTVTKIGPSQSTATRP